MRLDEVNIGDILYRYEQCECSEGWDVKTPLVDKVTDIELNPYSQYGAFIRFQNSDSETVYKGCTEIVNLFKTEEELIKHIQSELKIQMQKIRK